MFEITFWSQRCKYLKTNVSAKGCRNASTRTNLAFLERFSNVATKCCYNVGLNMLN